MKLSRSQNAKKNLIFGLINKAVTLFFPFLIRMILIRTLGAEYLGLNSLFSSILQVLNLTELGFSSAVIYCLYKPIAEDDIDTIRAILNFYRKIYFYIGIIITLIGFVLLPFIPKLIRGSYPENINIYVIYIIYLVSTALSYILFAYKNVLLTAYQRFDLISNINSAVQIVIYIIQIIIIIYLKNYYYYVGMLIIASLLLNISTEICSRKIFPSLFCTGSISVPIKKEILVKVKGLIINKLCATTRNSFDSIFISFFLGLTDTAIYSNYYYIMNAVIALLGIVSPSIIAGIGNSIATESQQKNYKDMKRINFIYMWISGWCTVCLLCLYQPFTELFFGKDMMFTFPIVIFFCLYFYTLKMGDIRGTYSDAKGLWWENRYRAIIETILNLILNYFLGKYFGIIGIILATWISLFFINFLWGSTILFKYYFTDIKISEYYLSNLSYSINTIIIGLTTYILCKFVTGNLQYVIFIRFFVCMIVPNFLYYIFYKNTKIFDISSQWIKKIW